MGFADDSGWISGTTYEDEISIIQSESTEIALIHPPVFLYAGQLEYYAWLKENEPDSCAKIPFYIRYKIDSLDADRRKYRYIELKLSQHTDSSLNDRVGCHWTRSMSFDYLKKIPWIGDTVFYWNGTWENHPGGNPGYPHSSFTGQYGTENEFRFPISIDLRLYLEETPGQLTFQSCPIYYDWVKYQDCGHDWRDYPQFEELGYFPGNIVVTDFDLYSPTAFLPMEVSNASWLVNTPKTKITDFSDVKRYNLDITLSVKKNEYLLMENIFLKVTVRNRSFPGPEIHDFAPMLSIMDDKGKNYDCPWRMAPSEVRPMHIDTILFHIDLFSRCGVPLSDKNQIDRFLPVGKYSAKLIFDEWWLEVFCFSRNWNFPPFLLD